MGFYRQLAVGTRILPLVSLGLAADAPKNVLTQIE